MADSRPPKNTAPAGEKLEVKASDAPQTDAASGPTLEEMAERQLNLEKENAILRQQVEALLKATQARAQKDEDAPEPGPQPGEPIFDESLPHGTVVGDTEVAYVQDGHQFGRDRRYLRTERHRGSPRPFNLKLVGVVKPRVAAAA